MCDGSVKGSIVHSQCKGGGSIPTSSLHISVKDLLILNISFKEASRCIKAWHYSKKPYCKSQIHHGVVYNKALLGVLSWGPSLDVHKTSGLVPGTAQDQYLELNRMALSPALPKNSASRCLAVSVRLLKKDISTLHWLVSYADGCQSGYGSIYQAAGWLLTQVKKNTTLWKTPDGRIVSDVGMRTGSALNKEFGSIRSRWREKGLVPLEGYQLRYMKFLSEKSKSMYTGKILPYKEAKCAESIIKKDTEVTSVPRQIGLFEEV